MRPPICEVCGREADATVSFADYQPLPEGMTGHPRGVGWFCRRHLELAEGRRDQTMSRVVRSLLVRRLGFRLALVGLLLALVFFTLWWVGLSRAG